MSESKLKRTQLSIIIINYQTDDLVLNLLQGLGVDADVEIILVDQSPINTLETKLPKRNDQRYFFVGKNLGFSGGNNYGVAQSRGEWILLLNSDTLVSSSSIRKLISITKENDCLVSAPKLAGSDARVQNNVGFFDSFRRSPINFLFARPRFIDCSAIKKIIEVDLLTGAAMLIHRSVFDKIGLLDEKNFFMYFEDIDFSMRLHNSGIKVLYVPDVEINHLGGGSSNHDMSEKNKNYLNGLSKYLRKHRGNMIEWLNNRLHFLS